jgi:hypothetical protein
MYFELSKSLIVSMWTHNSWPKACSQPLPVPVPVVAFCLFIYFFTWVVSYQWAWLWACELTACGPRSVHSHNLYRQWFFSCYFIFSQVCFDLSISLIVYMWVHSSWLWAYSQPLPVPAVVFSLLIFFSTVFWAINELDYEHVSSQFMAQGLLTATTDTGSGFFLVSFFFFNYILSYQWAWLWTRELIVDGLGPAYSHCRYRQWIFAY